MATTGRARQARAQARAFEERSREIIERLQKRVHKMSVLERQWTKLFHVPLDYAAQEPCWAMAFLMGQKRALESMQSDDMQALAALSREIYSRPLPRAYDVYRLPRKALTMEEVTTA